MLSTYKILLNGRVQGVGFRPFVSRLAGSMGLTGTVSNNENGVIIIASGSYSVIDRFYKELVANPPPLARIKEHFILSADTEKFSSFDIIPTQTVGKLNLALTPDFGICDSCREEVSDPDNRRYLYPFTTCVNCGPRWSITNSFPFERLHTSILEFEMCPVCQSEYEDQKDRRFHSQTNSCPECGIQMELMEANGELVDLPPKTLFKKVSELISEGKILAIKNTGGYLLCCDATRPEVIKRLRKRKKRPDKPFAVLYPSVDLLQHDLKMAKYELKELCSSERPIVILSSDQFKGDLPLEELAPGLRQLGVMLPYSGILELLAKELGQPIVATSGNIHGSPVISDKEQSMRLISGVADYFLHHNLSISNAQDDSVVKFSFRYGHRIMFRRSRGFAPNYFDYREVEQQKGLALGGHLKSTIAFTPNDYLYISQYLGNLDHFEVFKRFTETGTVFRQIFQEEPDYILVDRHPAYLSTQFGEELALEIDVPVYRIQHHMAHFSSVLGENNLFGSDDKILGVIWDGTGYGDDGQIWGGEFFNYRKGEMKRSGHFEYFPWLAGDKMAKEPRLSLFALSNDEDASFLMEKFAAHEREIYLALKKSNKLLTSSVGRLFDAVASLLSICDINTYEGEAAILLENTVSDFEISELKSYLQAENSEMVLTGELWENLYRDYCNGAGKEEIILNFLFTLATVVTDLAGLGGYRKIALSGGVFQNTILTDMLIELSENRFELFFNRNLAPNDENISFGQMMYFMHCMPKAKEEQGISMNTDHKERNR